MSFDPVSYAMGKQAGGGGGGGVTVEPLSVTENGTYTAPSGKAYSPVTVNVENSYTLDDEGKVVIEGKLVEQGTEEITENGTYDTTEISEAIVNVSGGGGAVPSYTEYAICTVGSSIKEIVEKAGAEAATSLIWLEFENLGVRYIVAIRKTVSGDNTLHDLSFGFRLVTTSTAGSLASIRYNDSYEVTSIGGVGLNGKKFRLGYIRLAA